MHSIVYILKVIAFWYLGTIPLDAANKNNCLETQNDL